MRYKKSQYGWLMIGIFAPITLFLIFAYLFQWGNNPITLVPFIIITLLFGIILAIFYKLTIAIDGSALKIIYGIGWIKFSFQIDSLISTRTTRIPWYYGLGIKATPRGMLYNIQGLNAVEIRFVSNGVNRFVMVGTPEPKRLCQELEEAFDQTDPIG